MEWFGQVKSAVYPRFWITSIGTKFLSFQQHHQRILNLDANLSEPLSDNAAWTSVQMEMLRGM